MDPQRNVIVGTHLEPGSSVYSGKGGCNAELTIATGGSVAEVGEAKMQRSNARTANRSRVEREAQPLSIVVGVFGPLVVIVAAGVLVIQLEVAQHGAVMDLNSRVVRIGSFEWLPYTVRAGFVLLGLAAALVYRRVLRTNAMKVLALTALIVITVAALYAFRPLPDDEDSHPLVIFGVFYGASSPFPPALMAAVIADIIFGRKKLGRAAGRRN